MPLPVRAVVFDAVGTLIHPHPSVAEAYHAAGRRHGSSKTVAEVSARFSTVWNAARNREEAADDAYRTNPSRERQKWRRIVAAVFDDLPHTDGLFADLWRHFADPRHWAVFDDVPSVWRELARRGMTLAIASNFDDRLEPIIKGLRALSECRHVGWSTEIGFGKPDGRFFETVQRRLGLAVAELLMIGDDRRCDYDGAISAGWKAILLDRQGVHNGSLVRTATSLTELPKLLE